MFVCYFFFFFLNEDDFIEMYSYIYKIKIFIWNAFNYAIRQKSEQKFFFFCFLNLIRKLKFITTLFSLSPIFFSYIFLLIYFLFVLILLLPRLWGIIKNNCIREMTDKFKFHISPSGKNTKLFNLY